MGSLGPIHLLVVFIVIVVFIGLVFLRGKTRGQAGQEQNQNLHLHTGNEVKVRCPACRALNPEKQVFCGGCGVKL